LRRIHYHDAPDTADFAAAPTTCTHRQAPPLHLKPGIGAVDYDRVAALYTSTASTKHFFQQQRRWVEDEGLFEQLLRRRVPGSRAHRQSARFVFSADDTEQMTGVKFDIGGEVAALCAGWPRAEKENTRRRPLFESFINDNIFPEDLAQMRQSTSARVRRQVAEHRYALLFDFQSWYDQLPLSPGVRRFFGVRLPGGRTGRLRATPMGFRGSCHVAQSVTWVLADFLQHPKYRGLVHSATCIDNVRFVSNDKELLKEAGREFIERCKYVGATLNDFSLEPTQEYEFLGTAYCHGSAPAEATRRLAEKSVRKLQLAQEVLAAPHCTRRQLAAVFGIALYGADVLRGRTTTPALHYNALSFFRRRIAGDDANGWDDEVTIPTSIRSELNAWLALLHMNHPVPADDRTSTMDDVDDYDLVIVSDASELGWGALAWSPGRGTIETASGTWQARDLLRDMGHSTVSEPAGIRKALLRFVSPTMRRVLVLTDHMGVCFAVQRGFGKSEDYNDLCVSIATYFPTLAVDAAYIPGTMNPADAASRGMTDEQQEREINVAHMAKLTLQAQELAATRLHRHQDTGDTTWMV
jgi:hypothetical protein